MLASSIRAAQNLNRVLSGYWIICLVSQMAAVRVLVCAVAVERLLRALEVEQSVHLRVDVGIHKDDFAVLSHIANTRAADSQVTVIIIVPTVHMSHVRTFQ